MTTEHFKMLKLLMKNSTDINEIFTKSIKLFPNMSEHSRANLSARYWIELFDTKLLDDTNTKFAEEFIKFCYKHFNSDVSVYHYAKGLEERIKIYEDI